MKKTLISFAFLASIASYANDLRGDYELVSDDHISSFGSIDPSYYINCPEVIEVTLENDNLPFSHPEQKLNISGATANGIVLIINPKLSMSNGKISKNKATNTIQFFDFYKRIVGAMNTTVNLNSNKERLTIKRSALIRFSSTCVYKRI